MHAVYLPAFTALICVMLSCVQATLLLPYMTAMSLGRTFNAKHNKVGVDIFKREDMENAQKIVGGFTDSKYKQVDSSVEARDFLDISGELSLDIKAGLVGVKGSGSYLKDTTSRTKFVEILVKVHFETETHTINTNTQPRDDWELTDKEVLGTHYIRSITYGGDLVASLRFTAENAADKLRIKAAIDGSIQAGGVLSVQVKGEFEKLKEDLKDSSSLEIQYFATVPVEGVPRDIDGLMKLVDEFPNHVKQVENGLGVPLRVEMLPLKTLSANQANYLKNRALQGNINDLELRFDDLRFSKRTFDEWATNLPAIPSNIENQIGEYNDKLDTALQAFYKVIGSLDTSHSGHPEQFKPAKDAYLSGGANVPGKYYRLLTKLMNEVEKKIPALEIRGGAIYTRWGSTSCPGTDAKLVYDGYAGGASGGFGGGANYLCLPKSPEWAKFQNGFQHLSNLYGIEYHTRNQPYGNALYNKDVVCAVCRVPKRQTTLMIPAKKTCPDGWTEEYKGYLMSEFKDHKRSEYICVDESPLGRPGGNANHNAAGGLYNVEINCGALPCYKYPSGREVSCVVCTN